MKRLLLPILFLASLSLRAQDIPEMPVLPRLSDSAFASVLTCGPGDEFYTAFGHSAIRVCDSTQDIDMVYNYGTFDFGAPHFYWTFARGNLNYYQSRESYTSFLWCYGYEGRYVYQQRLRLSNQELNNLFTALEVNNLPEYRYYMYDFFRDNCATRVRDMVSDALCHRTLAPEAVNDTNYTYRDMVTLHTDGPLRWWRFIIDMALGIRCDHRCSNYEYMFSPIEMMAVLDTLQVSDTQQPLVSPAEQLLPETRTPLPDIISPYLTFLLLFVVVLALTLLGWRKGWKLRWLDIILYSIMFLASLLILFLWFFSAHYCAKVNLNILWASPLLLYFIIRGDKAKRWMTYLQCAMLVAAIVITFVALPQKMNAAVLWIALTLLVRLLAPISLKS